MTAPIGQFVDVGNGWKLHYHAIGAGPPVVFLHGSGPGASGWSNFHQNVAAINAAGFQAILCDSLGYGLSDKPTDVDYTLEVMSSAVVGLLDALGHAHVTLVGNSQGGALAIRIALDHPARVGRLVLMAPGGLEERETFMQMRGIRSMMRCLYGPEGLTRAGMKMLFENQLFDASLVSEALVDERTEAALAQPLHVFKSMRVDNLEHELGRLACPVLGLWGMDDQFCPVSGATKLAERVPNVRVTLFNRCGHWVMVEHAAVFDRLCVDFLLHG